MSKHIHDSWSFAKQRAFRMRKSKKYVPHIDRYRELFAEFYIPVEQPEELILQIPSLQMKKNERVHDFELRVSELTAKLHESLPESEFIKPEALNNLTQAQNEALNQAIEDYTDEIRKAYEQTQALQMFLCYIGSPYKEELQREKPATLKEAYKKASEIERRAKPVEKTFTLPVNAVQTTEKPKLDEEETSLIAEMRQMVQAMRKWPAREDNKESKNKQQNGSKPSKYCHYCRRKGHIQEDCYKRQNKKDPCTDKDGRKYQPLGNGNRKYLDQVEQVSNIQDFPK